MNVAVADRALAVRRNTRLLTVAHTAMQMTFPVMLVVAGPAAKEITGRAGAVGLLSAVYFVAVGIATEATERGAALGSMDLVVSSMSAVAGLTGGLVLDVAGYRTLGIGVAVVVAVALVPVVGFRRQPVPIRGRPDGGGP